MLIRSSLASLAITSIGNTFWGITYCGSWGKCSIIFQEFLSNLNVLTYDLILSDLRLNNNDVAKATKHCNHHSVDIVPQEIE